MKAAHLRSLVSFFLCFSSSREDIRSSAMVGMESSGIPLSLAYMYSISSTVIWSIRASNCGQ